MMKICKGFFALAMLLPIAPAFAQTPAEIVGMSIACSNDRVYVWYANGTVTIGTSSDLGAHQPYLPPHTYSLPPGKSPSDIVGMGIAGNDHVYAWYMDGTVSSGTSSDLDKYRAPYSYSLAPGKLPTDVVGIDIACSNDHVYVWYRDGTASSGTSSILDKYRGPYNYTLASGKSPGHLVELGIAGNDHVYAWYLDRTVSSGTTDDLDKYRLPYRYSLITGPCEISADLLEFNELDRVINGIGSRGPSCESAANMTVYLKQDRGRFMWDKTLAESGRRRGINFEVPVRYQCSGTGGMVVYVEVESGDRKVQSSRVAVNYCQ